MGIITDAKAKIGQMVEGAANVAKTVALKTADGIAKASKLSPAQLKAIEESREKYLSAKPNANPTEFIEKLLGTIGIEAYQAYLPQIKQVYSPVENSFEKFNAENRIAYFDITKWVFDKEENYIDKLVNVYHVLSEENCNIALIYNRKQTGCKVSFAVVNNTEEDDAARSSSYAERLENALRGNFPGIETNIESNKSHHGIPEYLKYNQNDFSVATISNLATEKSEKFISQSMEKLLDGIVPQDHSEEYTLILLATPSKDILKKKTRLYELSSDLAPYSAWQANYTYTENEGNSSSVNAGVNLGVFKSSTNTVGANAGVSAAPGGVGPSAGVSASHSSTTGMNFGVNFSRSSSVNVSVGKTEGLTQTFTNFGVKHTLELLEEQMKRLDQCSALGMWEFAGYVFSKDSRVTNNVAHMYLALTQGEKSYMASSAINIWENEIHKEECGIITESLLRLQHPLFGLDSELVKNDESWLLYPPLIDATALVSGKELAYSLNVPRKSVSGLPVLECAPFGREVHKFNENSDDKEKISLGCIYHMRQAEAKKDVPLSLKNLASHTFITGSTGSGKSYTVYKMLSELKEKEIKFLVIEPAKGEYKNEFGKHADAVYGNNPKLTALLRIDPFSFYGDTHILEHLDRLIEIFNVCWPMYAAMPAVLKEAVEKSYEDCGWNLTESTNKYGNNLYPTFADVMRNIRTVIDSSDYDKDNKGAYKGSLETRLRSLTNGINGQIFTTDELSNEELFDRNVIVDLSRVGSSETKSLIMGLLVLKLQEYRMNQGSSKLKHVTVLEEAHNLLKRTSTEQSSESANLIGKSVEMLTNSIAEMRSFGEGFIIADQAPGLLDMAVIRNTNTKIILRLPEQSDRELVGKSANLNDDQITELAKLPCGVAAVYQNEWVEPVLCKVKKFEDCGKFNFEDKNENTKQNNNARNIVSLQITRLLLSLRDEKEAERINLYLDHLSFPSSLYVSIKRYIDSKPKKPDFVKLGPIVSELLPDLKKSILENPFENRTLEDVRHNLHVLICELVKDETLRQNLLQCFLSDYAYNVLGNPERLSDLKRKENQ